MPAQQDAFGQSLVSRLWPSSGYRGAMQSPYLPVVQPLLQSYDSAMGAMLPAQGNDLGPAQVNKPPPTGPTGGSNPSGVGALMKIVDPAGNWLMGK